MRTPPGLPNSAGPSIRYETYLGDGVGGAGVGKGGGGGAVGGEGGDDLGGVGDVVTTSTPRAGLGTGGDSENSGERRLHLDWFVVVVGEKVGY